MRKNDTQEDMAYSQIAVSRVRTLNFSGVQGKFGSDEYYIQLDSKNLTVGLENRVCDYVRLYTSFINAGKKFLLAHNKYVSTFNLIKDKWVEHKKYDEGYVRQIFRNRLVLSKKEKRAMPHDQSLFDIGILVGDSTFHFTRN